MAPQLCRCDPVEVMIEPAPQHGLIEIEPLLFVTIMPAEAAIGNANASNAKTTTRLMFIPSQDSFSSQFHLEVCLQGIGRLVCIVHLLFQNQ